MCSVCELKSCWYVDIVLFCHDVTEHNLLFGCAGEPRLRQCFEQHRSVLVRMEPERGTAAIKEQYVYVLVLWWWWYSLSVVADVYLRLTRFLTTKEKFHEFLASARPRASRDEADGDPEEPSGEPEQKRVKLDRDAEQKKKKMRGQNKSRPHIKPQSYEERRLCPSIVQVRLTHASIYCTHLYWLTVGRNITREMCYI